jgi:hypothetical protein
MASKEEREHKDQHVGHVAFRIPDFWPNNPSTWFRKIEKKFRICNIKQSSTKYDHLLSALPTDICSSINDSLAEIDENAADAYEQLKALLMSRYTMDRWARAFELYKFPEIGDMKPSEMMRQMKALLPPDSTPGTYFMAAFLLRLPADMIDHLLSRRRLQTHPRFRFLVRPRAAGRPSRLPGAGLQNSGTALQDAQCRRDAALQVRRHPLLHNAVSTVPASIVPSHRQRRKRQTVRHTIETTGRPVFAKARRLDPDKLRKAEA